MGNAVAAGAWESLAIASSTRNREQRLDRAGVLWRRDQWLDSSEDTTGKENRWRTGALLAMRKTNQAQNKVRAVNHVRMKNIKWTGDGLEPVGNRTKAERSMGGGGDEN
jgi:hypothetical protein